MTPGAQPWCSVTLEGWDGGGGREGAYVYLWLIHAGVWQRPTQYCSNHPPVKNKFINKNVKVVEIVA